MKDGQDDELYEAFNVALVVGGQHRHSALAPCSESLDLAREKNGITSNGLPTRLANEPLIMANFRRKTNRNTGWH